MQQTPAHFTKTRIAPTPSGFLHLGNALSFALTAALAHKAGAKILLRIDDLDRDRIRPEYVQDIFDTLNFLQIPWHHGPHNMDEYKSQWSQMQRMDLYRDALDRLKQNGNVFACTCSRADIPASGIYPGTCLHKGLPLDTPDASWRLVTNDNDLSVNTYPSGIIKAGLPPDMRYFVARKRDGFPAYQLASLIDDLHYGIDLIVRGNDLWPSTFAQLQLAQSLNQPAFQNTTFYHHRLLMAGGDKKLSKSAGDTSVKHLRQQGKTAVDVYSIIALLCGKQERVNNWLQLSHLFESGF
jgi:glutamyl/glutaminyl-tRNA synthetase